MSSILIVEDEKAIADFVSRGLRAAGYTTEVESSGAVAVALAVQGDFSLIVLDVGLPDMDGFEVLRQLRGQGVRAPVIMLTARSDPSDMVAGLDGGADDYMTKPFSFDVLLARIRLRLRGAERPATEEQAPMTLSHGRWTLDLRARTATVDGSTVELPKRQFALAEAFLRNPGIVLSREQLLSSVWGYDFDPGSNVVDVYVGYLRRALGSDFVETVRGLGYRLP